MPGDLPVFLESVQAAERAGYERAYLVDGQLLWRNVFVYMTHGLAATERMPFGVTPEGCNWGVQHVRAGAENAGRDPDDVEITLYTAMWVSDDVDEARRMTKWAAACARNHLTDVARRVPDHGMPEPIMRLV